jgi:hypothetical protein
MSVRQGTVHEMTAAEISQAQRLVTEWSEEHPD